MRTPEPGDDEGAILVLVLVFLAFFGVVIVALLGQGDTSLKNSSVIEEFGKKVYSADSALDVAIEAVQTDATLCANESASATTITSALVVDPDIEPVTVTCRTTAGTSGGWRGFGVITTSTAADSLRTQSGGPAKSVGAAVFVNGGTSLQRPVEVQGASFIQSGAPCATDAEVQVLPSPPHRRTCTPTPLPTLDAVPPAVPTTTDPPPDSTVPGCRVFSPGVYTTAPSLHPSRNYFKSGVYYFDYTGNWAIDKTSLVGGTTTGTTYLDAPCLDETTPDGDGVVFVMRGSATMTVENGARVELHKRVTSAADGSPAMSVFVQGSRSSSAIDQLTGNPQVVFHGTVYSPQADVGTNATGGVSFYMLNGVVASRLVLQSTGDGLLVSLDRGATQRTVVVEALAKGAGGGRTVKAHAVLTVQPDRTVQVKSRRSE